MLTALGRGDERLRATDAIFRNQNWEFGQNIYEKFRVGLRFMQWEKQYWSSYETNLIGLEILWT